MKIAARILILTIILIIPILLIINHNSYKNRIISKNSLDWIYIDIFFSSRYSGSKINLNGKQYEFNYSKIDISPSEVMGAIWHQRKLINRTTTHYWPWEYDEVISLRPFAIIKSENREIYWYVIDSNDIIYKKVKIFYSKQVAQQGDRPEPESDHNQ
jgi:hypothetical protein